MPKGCYPQIIRIINHSYLKFASGATAFLLNFEKKLINFYVASIFRRIFLYPTIALFVAKNNASSCCTSNKYHCLLFVPWNENQKGCTNSRAIDNLTKLGILFLLTKTEKRKKINWIVQSMLCNLDTKFIAICVSKRQFNIFCRSISNLNYLQKYCNFW